MATSAEQQSPLIVRLAIVAAGGFLGTCARYLVQQSLISNVFMSTFVINTLGCFLLGLIIGPTSSAPNLRLALGTGFCGAFTTYGLFALIGIAFGPSALGVMYAIVATFTGFAVFVWGASMTNKRSIK